MTVNKNHKNGHSQSVEVGKARRIEIETKSIVDAVEDSSETVYERFNHAVKNTHGYTMKVDPRVRKKVLV